jgi:hypothetical protein
MPEGLSYRGEKSRRALARRRRANGDSTCDTKGKPERRQDPWILRTWGAGVLRPYKEKPKSWAKAQHLRKQTQEHGKLKSTVHSKLRVNRSDCATRRRTGQARARPRERAAF